MKENKTLTENTSADSQNEPSIAEKIFCIFGTVFLLGFLIFIVYWGISKELDKHFCIGKFDDHNQEWTKEEINKCRDFYSAINERNLLKEKINSYGN